MSVVSPSWARAARGRGARVHVGVEPPRTGTTEPLPDDLDPRVASALVGQGITALYRHQARGLGGGARGEQRRSSRPAPRSGKSPRVQPARARRARARAEEPRALPLPDEGARAGSGARARRASAQGRASRRSTTATRETERRWQIRKWANVILTNPDMLHVGVLPHHDRWGDVLANLRYVVVDEAHVYRGVFGSHVANVLRRLRRLARVYGAEPQFLLASATIANPGELGRVAARRAGDRDRQTTPRRAPSATVVLWNPPLLDAELGLRASAARRRVAPARRARRSAACGRSASRRAARRPS